MTFRLIARSVWTNPGNRGKRLRKTLDAVGWQFHKRVIRAAKTIVLPNGRKFIAHCDCVVSSALIYAEWPEYRELMFLRTRFPLESMVLDVGAYVGHIGLLLSDLVDPADIIAFEPSPVSFSRLRENWETNGWVADKLFQVAVGSKAGTVYVAHSTSPVTTMQVQSTASEDTDHQIGMVRLDDLRDLWVGRRIGLLKIDVEGAELDVLEGATQVLEEDRPELIMFESLGDTLDPRIERCLSSAGYTMFQLDEYGNQCFGKYDERVLILVEI